jgi:hypothetical protein
MSARSGKAYAARAGLSVEEFLEPIGSPVTPESAGGAVVGPGRAEAVVVAPRTSWPAQAAGAAVTAPTIDAAPTVAGGQVASACDLVGRRWAPDVRREPARGPQRISDLRRRLAGISANLIAARLHELQHADVARRRLLPPPAGSTVY